VEIDGVSDKRVEPHLLRFPGVVSVLIKRDRLVCSDQWAINPRLTLSFGLRFDNDNGHELDPCGSSRGFLLALTRDGKTLLKGGVGRFYDRVPLMAPTFPDLPDPLYVLRRRAKFAVLYLKNE